MGCFRVWQKPLPYLGRLRTKRGAGNYNYLIMNILLLVTLYHHVHRLFAQAALVPLVKHGVHEHAS